MQNFRDILYVSHGISEETEPLKQALNLASHNQAKVNALIVCPAFPPAMQIYQEQYEISLKQRLEKLIQNTKQELTNAAGELVVNITVESGEAPADRVIRYVLRNAFDLVIKQAEQQENSKGFKAIDMELLRKCPCPVWLCRPSAHSANETCVAVAIDPENQMPAARDLSLRLLMLSRSLADKFNSQLTVISCWDYEFEGYLHHSALTQITEEEIKNIVMNTQHHHRLELDELIRQSGITGRLQVHHIRGRAEEMIPQYVENQNIDILVMGTLARTGIAGFFIGNTAENIVQKLNCSLVALKPNGFVSPVKAY